MGALRFAYRITAAVNYLAGNASQPVCLLKNLIFADKAAVLNVMPLQYCQAKHQWGDRLRLHLHTWRMNPGNRFFPLVPAYCCLMAAVLIRL